MSFIENFCRLCAETLESYVEFGSLAHLTEIEKLNLPLSSDSKICAACYEFLAKIQRFVENSNKTENFLNFLTSNFQNPDEATINSARSSFGLLTKLNQETSTFDIDNPIVEEIQEENFVIEENLIEGEIEAVTEDDEEMIEEEIKIEVKEEDEKDQNDDFDFICHICHEDLKTFFALHSHTRKLHDTLPQVICPCGETLSSRPQLQSHRKIHSSKKFFACQECDKVYSHHQSLQNHIKRLHDDPKKIFACLKCPKKFESERKLKAHEVVHLPDDEKLIHACPFEDCDKKFSKAINVQAHVKAIHNKDRPYLCSTCGKDFSTKGALKEHQIIHSDQSPFACQFCDKKFKNLARLKTHEDTHGTTQYICNICGISLNTKRTLKMHMVVHSDQKRFKCQFCGASFKRSKALKNHLILHSGLRPYACPFCDKTFANGSNCRSHKKKSHPNELAAYEAAGKSKPTPNIPKLHQLMPKDNGDQLLFVDSAGNILQEIPSDIKPELPSIVIQTTENFQIVNEK